MCCCSRTWTETIEYYPLLGDCVVMGKVGIVQDGEKILQGPPLCHCFQGAESHFLLLLLQHITAQKSTSDPSVAVFCRWTPNSENIDTSGQDSIIWFPFKSQVFIGFHYLYLHFHLHPFDGQGCWCGSDLSNTISSDSEVFSFSWFDSTSPPAGSCTDLPLLWHQRLSGCFTCLW